MSNKGERKVMFLTGAGASVEAGVCTSDKITEVLVN
jgi:NAD-dependent SIR2 family protein deacetylase